MSTNLLDALRAIGWTLLLLSSAVAQEKKPAATLSELRQELEQHLAQAKFAQALWGVKIVSLEEGKTVFEHNAHTLFSPASNCKLFTVALALDQLGPDYRIKTSLYATAKPDASGKLDGDLIIYGRGDPTINGRLHHGHLEEALQPLVNVLTNGGVKRIGGDLIGDATYFVGPPAGSGWAWDDLEYNYGAPLSALTLNDNVVQASIKPAALAGAPCQVNFSPANVLLVVSNRSLTVEKSQARTIILYRPLDANVLYVLGQMPVEDAGYVEPVPVLNPAYLFAVQFREALARSGITVDGQIRALDWPASGQSRDGRQWIELGSVESPPLSEIAREVQKPSQNLYADLLLSLVGENSRSETEARDRTSEELGIVQMNKFLAKAGIAREEAWFEEGSGLSRDDLATPNAIVTLLQFMSRHPGAGIYFDALPVAGVDGTLRNRMVGTPAARNVRAKTGSLRWAGSLSGQVTTARGERLLFSIMLNRYQNLEANRSTRAEIDFIPILLAGFAGRTAE